MPQGRAAHGDVRARWARPGGRARGPGRAPQCSAARAGGVARPPAAARSRCPRPRAPRDARRWSSVQQAPCAHPMAIRAHHRLTHEGLTPRATACPDPPPRFRAGAASAGGRRAGLHATPPPSGWTQISPPEASHGATRDTLGQRAAPKHCRPDAPRIPPPPPGAHPHPAGATIASARSLANSANPDARRRPPRLTPPAAPAPPARRPGRSPPARPSRAPGRWRVRGARP